MEIKLNGVAKGAIVGTIIGLVYGHTYGKGYDDGKNRVLNDMNDNNIRLIDAENRIVTLEYVKKHSLKNLFKK